MHVGVIARRFLGEPFGIGRYMVGMRAPATRSANVLDYDLRRSSPPRDIRERAADVLALEGMPVRPTVTRGEAG